MVFVYMIDKDWGEVIGEVAEWVDRIMLKLREKKTLAILQNVYWTYRTSERRKQLGLLMCDSGLYLKFIHSHNISSSRDLGNYLFLKENAEI